MTLNPIQNIVICGSGLASWMTAAALSKNLPSTIQIIVLETSNSDAADIFYGTAVSPSAYNFFVTLGLTEADLITQTQSSFSYGTHYENWGGANVSWTQCFHSPFPNWSGVPFAHYISSDTEELEHYLVSAQAAHEGKFAHPPADQSVTLSSAEYGYHIKTSDLTKLTKKIAMKAGVKSVSKDITSIESYNGVISSLELSDGQALSADLYVDTSGPDAILFSSLEKNDVKADRVLGAFYSKQKNEHLGAPIRRITSHDFGWQSTTPLQGIDAILTVFDLTSEQTAREAHSLEEAAKSEISIKHRDKAWSGNCVALGQAAAVVEPITPAPMMLLQMDIERLLGLIPVTANYDVEEKIFNESLQTDIENIQLFNSAFFQTENLTGTAYWKAAKAGGLTAKLDRKLKQFSNRGLLVSYDLEPFNDEDWTILHHGIGRMPQKKDIFAALSDVEKISHELQKKANSIQDIVAKMPPHHIYMANYLSYLERNYVSEI